MKDLIYEIIETAGTIDAAGNRILKPFGLTPMSYNVLNLLEGTALSQRELGDKLIVVASSVTFQVRQLQKRGWLKRRRADRRTWLVSLTPAGAAVLQAATLAMDRMMARVRVTPGSLTAAREVLRELRQQIPSAATPPAGS